MEQSYMVPSGAALRDMTKSQEAAYRAIQNYQSNRMNNTLDRFNKQYGSDYARATTKIVDGKSFDVITFGKYITPPPPPPTPSPASAQASATVDPSSV